MSLTDYLGSTDTEMKSDLLDGDTKPIISTNPTDPTISTQTKISHDIGSYESVKEKCKSYTDCVYKMCNNYGDKQNGRDSKKYLVILSKCAETKTNENRTCVVDKTCAKFRADMLKVENIIDVDTLKTKNQIAHVPFFDGEIQCYYETIYRIGNIVRSTIQPCGEDFYDKRINWVCGHGIHYFLTLEPAYFYGMMPDGYSGTWKRYDDDGTVLICRKAC
jgi:hypothetical protein